MNKSTTRLTLTALFVALVLLFGLTPIGMIPLGFINISLLGIPVVVGTLVLGLDDGDVAGALEWMQQQDGLTVEVLR